ncbi:MAG: M23 family metallopeptidase [Clostridiales bacterium]|nr:M23 family metallopeptidase [Clostridiales bacterium]
MNQKQKQRKLTRNISVALAVLIVATLCVTIAALTAAKRAKADPTPTGTSPTLKTEAPKGSTTPSQVPLDPGTQSQTPTSGNTPAVSVIVWTSPATGEVIKGYSADIPVFSLTMEDYRTHAGIDIEGDAGDDVFAAADGVIENVYYDPMMGQTVVIKHSENYTTFYQNLQTVMPAGIEKGASVKGGDKIGQVGDTALIEISENPHLHFSVYVDGKCADPGTYITVSEKASSTWYED